MKTKVEYFGMIAESLGRPLEEIVFESKADPLDLHAFFESKYPALKNMNYKIAVNQEFKTHLEPGCVPNEIALLPPFAGG